MILLLLLFYMNYGFIAPQNILCSNKQTSDKLIFQICSMDKYCSELYNIPFIDNYDIFEIDDFDNNFQFKNFNYLIKKTGLSYPLTINTILTNLNNNIVSTVIIHQYELENGLYHKLWSSIWKRSLLRINYMIIESNENSNYNNSFNSFVISDNKFIQYNSPLFIENLLNFSQNFDKCIYVEDPNSLSSINLTNTSDYLYNTFFEKTPQEFDEFMNEVDYVNILSDNTIKSMNVILSMLHILTIYKEHISLNETCNDVNERVYIDPNSGVSKCVCLEGKTCDNETNDTNIVVWVTLVTSFVVLVVCAVLIYATIVLLDQDREIQGKKYK